MNALFDVAAPPATFPEEDRCWVLRDQQQRPFSTRDTGRRAPLHFRTREDAEKGAEALSGAVPVLLDRPCAVVYCATAFETLDNGDGEAFHYAAAEDASAAAANAGWAVDTTTGTPVYTCPDCKEES